MIFDLKGKRRRTVQATYVALAFLMVVGLVGAGVGSGVSGGVFDLFSGGSGSSKGNQIVQNRIKAAQKRLAVNPKDQTALATLVRSHYELASVGANQQTGQFNAEGKKELALAATAWQRYTAAVPKPDPSLATVMLNAFGSNGLNRPAASANVAELIASSRNDAQSYLRLAACATVAKQTRKATLAASKAQQVVPKAQAKSLKSYLADAKNPAKAAQLCSQ